MSVANGIDLAREPQLLCGVLADRLEEVIPHDPGVVVGLHQRAVNQAGEEIEKLVVADALARGHSPRRVEGEPAREHRQASQQAPLAFAEQVDAPVDRRSQGLVAGHGSAGSTGQQLEPVAQALADLAG